jgi:uncharacterized protein (TIGR02265 family)
MLDDQARLRRRRLLVRPADQSSGFVFHGILDLVSRRAGREVGGQLREDCGVPRHIIPVLKYPAAQLLGLVDGAMDRLREVEPLDDGTLLEQLGAHTVEPYLDSPMGRLVLHLYSRSALELLGIAPTAFRATHTFGEMRVEPSEGRVARLVLQDMLLGPAYVAGIVRVGVKAICRLDADVQLESASDEGSHFTLNVRW